jgi:hypothetical protein
MASGFAFYTKAKDCRSQCQNSGVRVDEEDSTGQKMLIMGTLKNPHGIEVDEYGFTIVDLGNVGHKGEPWVLASTVAQVFYTLLFLQNNELSELTTWRMRKNTTNLTMCLSLWIQ